MGLLQTPNLPPAHVDAIVIIVAQRAYSVKQDRRMGQSGESQAGDDGMEGWAPARGLSEFAERVYALAAGRVSGQSEATKAGTSRGWRSFAVIWCGGTLASWNRKKLPSPRALSGTVRSTKTHSLALSQRGRCPA
jgi:hypothetical protein